MLLSMSTTDNVTALAGSRASSDSDYVSRAAAGDRRAYEALYREHCGQIYALCLRMTANAAEAEDATQDAFIQAWRKLDSFRGDSAFSSWLHRIAVNVVLANMRRRKREQAQMQLAPTPEPAREEPQHNLADLERAIAELPERARQVFVLAGVYGYSHQQVADTLDVAVGTCKAHLHRARQMLSEKLETQS